MPGMHATVREGKTADAKRDHKPGQDVPRGKIGI